MSFKKMNTIYYADYSFADVKEADWWAKYITTASKN
jgi:hypothetical protein